MVPSPPPTTPSTVSLTLFFLSSHAPHRWSSFYIPTFPGIATESHELKPIVVTLNEELSNQTSAGTLCCRGFPRSLSINDPTPLVHSCDFPGVSLCFPQNPGITWSAYLFPDHAGHRPVSASSFFPVWSRRAGTLLLLPPSSSSSPPPPPPPALHPLQGRPLHVPGFPLQGHTPSTSYVMNYPFLPGSNTTCPHTKDGRAPTFKILQTSDTSPPSSFPSLLPSCLAQRSSRSPGLLSTCGLPLRPARHTPTPDRLLHVPVISLSSPPALTLPEASRVTPEPAVTSGMLCWASLPGSLD